MKSWAGIAFAPLQGVIVYLLFGLLAASGLAWIGIDLSIDADDPALDLLAWRHGVLVIHGIVAGAALIMLGALMPGHARHAWRARRNRRSGALMTTAMMILIATGWALYYGTDALRDLASGAHQYLGAAAPLLLLLHRRLGVKRGRRRQGVSIHDREHVRASS